MRETRCINLAAAASFLLEFAARLADRSFGAHSDARLGLAGKQVQGEGPHQEAEVSDEVSEAIIAGAI